MHHVHFSLVIVNQIDIRYIFAFKTKNQSPFTAHGYGPGTSVFTLQPLRAQSGKSL